MESSNFNPHTIPEFLRFPNVDVSYLFKDKHFEEWTSAYKNWFLDEDRVAKKITNIKTINAYCSELCRYGLYIQNKMKKKYIDWHLNDLLLFHKTKGSTFNAANGIIFFEDPTQYMMEEDLPLSKKMKLLMGMVHAVEFISSKIIAGKDDCTLTIAECA